MINLPNDDANAQDKKNTRLVELLENMKADCVDYKTYQKIYSMIPELLICQKDEDIGKKELLWFPTKMTKRKLNKKAHKNIIEKLRIFTAEQNLIWNQLHFNEHFDDYLVRTIYKSN